MSKKFHLALSVSDIDICVSDFTQRLGKEPCVIIKNEYALWRTHFLNISIRKDTAALPGSLRHLGWEDPSAEMFSSETDVNGTLWERFTAQQQADEINHIWPGHNYSPGQSL
jgi:hypothetical protein